MKNKGLSVIRLSKSSGNPREVVFAKAWEKANRTGMSDCGLIKHLLGKEFTERDRAVAATIIQWLGSNVGMGFLNDVAKSNREIKEFLNIK